MGHCASKSAHRKKEAEGKALGTHEASLGAFVRSCDRPFAEHYETIKELGEGAYGDVVLVHHISSGMLRACKRLSISRGQPLARVLQEIEIMKELDHPHIVKVYEYFQQPAVVNIVMELCTGGELFEQVANNKHLTENEAARHMLSLVSALAYMHSIGIAHRDLKPENLLLESKSAEASIKLVDFGAATHFQPGTKMTSPVGTCYYLAPEAIKGKYDERCDVWSAGVIMFVLLTGSVPFNGRSEDEIFHNIRHQDLAFTHPVWKTVSHEAQALVKKMLKKNPHKRPTFEDLVQEPWLQKRGRHKLPDRPIAVESLQKLSTFNAQSKLHRATLSFITAQFTTQDELEELRALFEALDVNCDGKLSRSELEQGLTKYGIGQSMSVDELMRVSDLDGSGFIDYNEFLTAATDWSHGLNSKKLYEAFRVYDLNGDGKISIEEIRSVLGSDDTDDHFFMNILDEADINGDGEIDFEEFAQYIQHRLPPSN